MNDPVVITYHLSEPAVVLVDILTNGVSVGSDALTAMKGDAGHLVAAGDRRATWLARKAGLPKNVEDGSVKVTAKVQAWSRYSPPDYLVVDLTQPSNFTYYATAEAIPGGIQADVNKTDRMIFRKIPAAGETMVLGCGKNEMQQPVSGLGRRKAFDVHKIRTTDDKDSDWTEKDGYTITGEHLAHPMGFTNDYYLAIYECTQGQWLKLFGGDENPWGSTNCRYTEYEDSAKRPVTGRRYIDLRGNAIEGDRAHWPTDGHYVAELSQLQRFRNWTGLLYDLPTEAQWEFAARAGITTLWPSGNAFLFEEDVSKYAWNADNWQDDPVVAAAGMNQTHAVGQLRPNAWGLYDMLGNSSECCLDYMYSTAASCDPLKGAYSIDYPGPVKENATSQPYRVKRGSRHLESADKMRFTRRAAMNATLGSVDAALRAWLPAESPAWQLEK